MAPSKGKINAIMTNTNIKFDRKSVRYGWSHGWEREKRNYLRMTDDAFGDLVFYCTPLYYCIFHLFLILNDILLYCILFGFVSIQYSEIFHIYIKMEANTDAQMCAVSLKYTHIYVLLNKLGIKFIFKKRTVILFLSIRLGVIKKNFKNFKCFY